MAKTILIVDDNQNLCKVLKAIFLKHKYSVIEAGTGKEALEQVSEKRPDLVLLDTRLPDIGGMELCQKIKSMEGLNAKVIIYTGDVDVVNADKSGHLDADACFVKTIDFEILLKAIKDMLGD